MFDWWWEFLFGIAQTVLHIVDAIFKLFQYFGGIAPQSVQNELTGEYDGGGLIDVLFNNAYVRNAFAFFALIFVFLFVLAIIIGIARSEFADKDNKEPKVKLLKKSLLSLFLILLMPTIFALALTMTGLLLNSIVAALGGGDGLSISLSQRLFEACFETFNGDVKFSDSFWMIFNQAGYPMEQFNYFLCVLIGAILAVVLGIGVLQLVVRIINIIMFYLVSPFVLAVMPLDDGTRFNLWRDQVIGQLLSAGGMIMCLYLYFLLLPIVGTIFSGTSFLSTLGFFLFAIGGALSAVKGGTYIANLVGHSVGMSEGQQLAATTQMASTGLRAGLGMAGGLMGKSLGLMKAGGSKGLQIAGSMISSNAMRGQPESVLGTATDTNTGGTTNSLLTNLFENGSKSMVSPERQNSFNTAQTQAMFTGQPTLMPQQSIQPGLTPDLGVKSLGATVNQVNPLTSAQPEKNIPNNFKEMPASGAGLGEMLNNSTKGIGTGTEDKKNK